MMFWRAKVRLWGSVSASVRFPVTSKGWVGLGMNTSAGKAPSRVVRATKEGVDGACSRANVKTNDGAGGVVGVGEGGSGGAGIEEVLDPEEVVQAVWDLRFVSMARRRGIRGGGDKLQDRVCQVGG